MTQLLSLPAAGSAAPRHMAPPPAHGPVSRPPRLSPWWVAGAVLPLMVASDWRLRLRTTSDSINGSADTAVLVEIAVYAVVALYLATRFRYRPRRGPSKGIWLIAWTFAILTAVAAVWSPFPQLAVVRGLQLLVIAAVGQSIGSYATRDEVHRLLHAFVALVLVGVALGLALGPIDPAGATKSRFSWLALHPTLSATYLMVGFLVSVAYLVTPELRRFGPRWPAGAYLLAALVIGAGLERNETRGALGGAIVGLVLLALERVRRRDVPAVLLFTGILSLAVASALGNQIVSYVVRGEGVENLRTLNYRTELWGRAIDAWETSPIAGLGTGATRGIFLETTGLGGGHNAFFNVLVDTGLGGVLLWVALLITLCRAIYLRPWGGDRPLMLALFFALFVGGLTTEGLGESANVSMVLLFVLLGWVTAAAGRRVA